MVDAGRGAVGLPMLITTNRWASRAQRDSSTVSDTSTR